jgi:exodeoxyribonuclease V alpha subunit
MELPVIVSYCNNFDGGFALLSCELDATSPLYNIKMEAIVKPLINKKYDNFTVSIGMADLNEDLRGAQIVVVGDIVEHPKYGHQYKADFYYYEKPTTYDGLKAFLTTLPNIKESRSKSIIKKFGVEGTLDVLDNNIQRLIEINGITEKRIPPIKKAWEKNKVLRDLYVWLTEYKINYKLAEPIYKKWKEKSIEILNHNPYKIVEIKGVSFIQADKIAHKLFNDVPVEERVTACMDYCITEDMKQNGHLCIPYGHLKRRLLETLNDCDYNLKQRTQSNTYTVNFNKILKERHDLFEVVKRVEVKEKGKINQNFVYKKDIYDKEKYISNVLYKKHKQKCPISGFNNLMVDDVEKDLSEIYKKEIKLDETQKEAIISSFENKITVITGSGGTGKSTICKGIYDISKKLHLSVRMMSPTGKAAQVLSEKTGGPATTIHRGLGISLGDSLPNKMIYEDILIIDEISMCGIDTIYAIMYALEENENCNIVFVGDMNQLPSVSQGNFLTDLIKSKNANIVVLNKIHRQDENSYISIIANDISKGLYIDIPKDASDIRWKKLNVDNFEKTLNSYIDRYLAKSDISNLQIISPMKKGYCGVHKINNFMQEKMSLHNNTSSDFIQRGFQKFYLKDRVMQIENNYDKNVFNGDMGEVVDIGEKCPNENTDKKEKFVEVQFYEEKVSYFGSELDQLQLAWCITVHKFQGSQSKYVLFMMANEAEIMMSKELVYTAFSRAEKNLDIFGHDRMLRIAPTKSITKQRYTNLYYMLKSRTDDNIRLHLLSEKSKENEVN